MPKSPAALIGRHNRQRRPEEQHRYYDEPADEAMPVTALPQARQLPRWRRLMNRWARPGQQRLIPAKSTD
ncbi:MAG: hypothetical protein KDE59_27910 [Anaerolineales bacterium]|nr:hypothetical protein [Anaerolineales bacterium]